MKIVDYDPVGDSLFVRIPLGEYEYSISVDDIIFDVGKIEDKVTILGFEILDVSKKLRVSPYLLSRGIRKLYAEIKVTKDAINFFIRVEIIKRGRVSETKRNFVTKNTGLPTLEATIEA